MVLDLNTERELLLKQILLINDSNLLRGIRSLLQSELETQEGGGISLEQYNREIDEALQEIENGQWTDQETLMKEIEKW